MKHKYQSTQGESDPQVAAFVENVVIMSFEVIKNDHLSPSVLSKIRMGSSSAELFIIYDSTSDKKGFHYQLLVDDSLLWRRSFYTNRMGETPAIDNELLRDNYAKTTQELIVVDFMTQYREWPTRPLGELPES